MAAGNVFDHQRWIVGFETTFRQVDLSVLKRILDTANQMKGDAFVLCIVDVDLLQVPAAVVLLVLVHKTSCVRQKLGRFLRYPTQYEGLQAIQDSLETQQRFARRLDADATDLHQRAQKALVNDNNDELARQLLLQRTEVQDKLKSVLTNCVEEKKRREKMESNVAQLQRRATEVETLMRRSVSASLYVEDPLLKKFKDLCIDRLT